MTSSLLLAAGIILVLILLNAFFSLAETALTAASRARMATLEREGDKAAARVNELNENRERMIGAVLLGANLVTIAASAITATFRESSFAFSCEGSALRPRSMSTVNARPCWC